MVDSSWNPWKLTTIGILLVMATALVTGLVVANWSGSAADKKIESAATSATESPTKSPVASHPARVASGPPSQQVVDACNRQAAAQAPRDKTKELVKDSALGAVVGAAVGAAGGAIADGGKGAGKGAGIGGLLGAGGGALYGVNENRKNDERYRAAYAACMRARGYAG